MSKRPPRPVVRAWMIAAIEDQVQAVHRSMRELMAGE